MNRRDKLSYYSLVRPRWRKVFSDLWANKIRSLLVVLSIAVGVFAVGMITTIYLVLADDMRTSYASINPANLIISAQPFATDFLDTLRNIPGIHQVQGAWTFNARARSDAREWTSIDIKAIYKIDRMAIDHIVTLQGTWPPKEHQIAFDQYKLSDLHAKLGDSIEIRLPSGHTRRMQICAVIQDQSIGATGYGGFFVSPPQGYISFDSLAWLEQPEKLNQAYATVTGDPNDETALRQIANRVGKDFDQISVRLNGSVVRKTTDHPNQMYTDAIAGLLFVLCFLVVFLSAFLITNTLAGLLNQQSLQIGVMKTVGGRRYQIIGIYTTLIAIFSILALLVALPLSAQAAFAILNFLSRQINFQMQGYRFVPLAALLQVVLALVIPQAAGFFPILQGSRISVQEAIVGTDIRGGEKTSRVISGLRLGFLSRPLLLALRNTFRHKIRLLLTLFTLVLAGAIFIATINVRSSLTQYIDRLSKYFTADITLALDRPYRIEQIDQAVRQIPGVTVVEGWASTDGQLILENGLVGDDLRILAPPSDSQLIQPILTQGRWIRSGDQNVVTVNERFLERYPHLKMGDPIQFKIDGKKTTWIVVGAFQFAGKSGGYLAYGAYDYVSKLTHTPFQSMYYRIAFNSSDHSPESQQSFGTILDDHLKSLGYRVMDIETGHSVLNSTSEGINMLTVFLLILSSLTAMVGSIGLMGTMSMNVLERTREIGIMRSLGASDRTIMRLVIQEGLIIGGISWLLGSLLAFPISKGLADLVSYALFSAPASFRYSTASFIIWLAAVMLLSVLASVIPAYNASRLTIREVLAYE